MVDQARNDGGPRPSEGRERLLPRESRVGGSSGELRLRRGPAARFLIRFLSISGGLIGCLMLAAAGLFLRLAHGPISIDGAAPRIAAEISSRLGGGYDFSLGAASVENGGRGPTLAIDGFALKNAAGRTIVAAPRAEVSLAFLPLLAGSLRPSSLELLDVNLRLSILADGSVALSAAEEPFVLGRSPDLPTAAGDGASALRALAGAMRELVDFATRPESSIGSLERVGVARGKLIVEQAGGGTTVFDALELAFDKSAGKALFTLAASGPRGRWSLKAQAVGAPGGERNLDVEITDLSFDEIALGLGLRGQAASFDMPLSGRIRIGFAANGELAGASGGFAAGAGSLYFDSDRKKAVKLDEMSGRLRWNPSERRIDIEPTLISSGETRFTLTGAMSPPVSDGEPWKIEAQTAADGIIEAESPGGAPMTLDKIALTGWVFPGAETLSLDRFEIAGPQVNVVGAAEINWSAAARRLKIDLAAGRMPVQSVLRLWPRIVSPATREYLVEHVRGGTLEKGSLAVDFDSAALEAVGTDAPLAEERLRMEFAVSNGALAFLPGVPPLTGIDATGRVSGRAVTINVPRAGLDAAPGRRLAVTDAVFQVADTNRKPAPAVLMARVAGSLDAVGDFLAREGLKTYGGQIIDTSAMKGQLDGKLTIDMKLAKVTRAADTIVKVAAAINNFSLEKLIGKERFDQGTLSLVIDPAGLKASGQGRLFGQTASLELKKPAAGATDAVIQFNLDEAARARLGLNLGPGFSGPVGARLSAPFGKDNAPAKVELDLTRAAMDGLLPGLVKPAGRPAKASFGLDISEGSISVDQLVFDVPGGASARGSLELDSNGAFRSAKLASLRLSPGDDMKVEADQTKEGLKLVVRGNTLDARPFLRALTGPDSGVKEPAAAKDIDLDLKTGLATGYNRQSMSAVELRLTRRAGAVRAFQFQARSGRSQITGAARGGREGSISLASADGGAFLSFLDLYKRMEGGKMQLNARIADGGLDGSIFVSDFVLRDEPALSRLVAEGAPASAERAGQPGINTSAAAFQRLSARFTRGDGRFTVRDGVLVGQQIGLKLDGTLDTARDQIAMTGVFVPAYGLNNLFSQVPLFGPLLGGDRHEGLFAVNFRIAGPASAPVLTVNPLSAIAPGFLRKIFGAIDGTGTPQSGADEPGVEAAPAPAPPSRSMPMSIAPGRK